MIGSRMILAIATLAIVALAAGAIISPTSLAYADNNNSNNSNNPPTTATGGNNNNNNNNNPPTTAKN